jgi:uncharacterized glyoxalase superfamily protein PhnB
MHGMYVNGSSVMLSDPFPNTGMSAEAAANLMLLVSDIDPAFQRAVDAVPKP